MEIRRNLQQPETELDRDRSSPRDPLEVELFHTPTLDDMFKFTLLLRTDSHSSWADTEAGRRNGDRLLDVLGGLARLDCITDRALHTNHRGTVDLTERLDLEFELG